MTKRVLVVEDHELLAAGFRQLVADLDLELRYATSIESARDALRESRFDLVVQDLYLPDGDGLELCESLRSDGNHIPTVLVSGMLNGLEIQRATDLGVEGIVSKDDSSDEVRLAVESVLDGQTYQSESVARFIDALDGSEFLTPRATQVLHAIVSGLSNKEIAAKLDITEPTVSFHLAQLKKKLGARTNRQLVFKASRLGLTP